MEAAGAPLWFHAGKVLLLVGPTPFYTGWVDATASAHTFLPLEPARCWLWPVFVCAPRALLANLDAIQQRANP